MANILKIMDFNNALTETEIDLDNLEQLSMINVQVISGDEVVTVYFKDGTTKIWDSSNCRFYDFFDDEYILYSEYKSKEENEKMLSGFFSRKKSYWR